MYHFKVIQKLLGNTSKELVWSLVVTTTQTRDANHTQLHHAITTSMVLCHHAKVNNQHHNVSSNAVAVTQLHTPKINTLVQVLIQLVEMLLKFKLKS